MTLMNEKGIEEQSYFLLRISIGPVQEFISEARKSRDLFMGSRLLSKATLKSMNPILANFRKEAIIYPYIKYSPTCLNNSIPNIYMVKIPKVPRSELYKIVDQMEQELQKFWDEIKDEVGKRLPCSTVEYYEQMKEPLFYMNWVAIPITSDDLSRSYKSKVEDLLHFLEERKLTRTFGAWNGDNSVKCNQCGHRESMPDELFSQLRDTKQFKGMFRENEKLCSVCLLKRLLYAEKVGLQKPRFDSVVDISATTIKEIISKNESKEEVKEFNSIIDKLKEYISNSRIDEYTINSRKPGEFYYKDYLDYDFLKKEHGIGDNSNFKDLCKEAQEKISAVYKVTGINKPSKYYTIVSMDGDDMGKFMSGEFIHEEIFTIEYQKNLSKILAETASKTSDIIETNGKGQCIYSGGDDLLAFLPLKNSLETIEKLKSSFTDGFVNFDKKPTSSAGIVILHHRDPLQRGLIKSRENVEKAKDWFHGKNSFFITVRIFSGTVITWGYKWLIEDLEVKNKEGSTTSTGPISIIWVLQRLINFLTTKEEDRLSQKFLREFMEELPSFYKYVNHEISGNSKWVLNTTIFKLEFKRLLERHLPKKSQLKEKHGEEINLLEEIFAYMADPDKNKNLKKEYNSKVKENFENFLQISLFLSKELNGEGSENDSDTH